MLQQYALFYLRRPLPALSLLLLALASLVPHARAGDWPQILGPHRNGTAVGEELPETWPAGGPPTRWSVEVGSGYAGPAVVGERVVLFHRVDDKERVEAFDARTGRSLWQTDFPANYRGGIDPDKGPRCVPLIHEGRIYVYGAAGDLHCLDLADGRKRWTRNLLSDYAGQEGYFGAGSTPIVVGDKLLVNVGGRSGAGLVALQLADGRTAWKATDEQASYSSPTVIERGGEPQVVFVTRLRTVGIDPGRGAVQFDFPFGQRGPTVNAATPLQFGDFLFVTASYGIGARLVKIDGDQVTTVWADDETLSSQYTTPVYHDGYLYGTHGREDIGTVALRCVEAATGKVMWSEDGFGVAHIILAGGKLLILTTEGRLVLAPASPRRLEVLASHQLTSDTTRALPALSGGRLFVKTSRSLQDRLLCVDVGR